MRRHNLRSPNRPRALDDYDLRCAGGGNAMPIPVPDAMDQYGAWTAGSSNEKDWSALLAGSSVG